MGKKMDGIGRILTWPPSAWAQYLVLSLWVWAGLWIWLILFSWLGYVIWQQKGFEYILKSPKAFEGSKERLSWIGVIQWTLSNLWMVWVLPERRVLILLGGFSYWSWRSKQPFYNHQWKMFTWLGPQSGL